MLYRPITSKLEVVVLPTGLKDGFCFHARILKPDSKILNGFVFLTLCVRKWRYSVSDIFGAPWNEFGRSLAQRDSKYFGLHNRISSLLLRKGASQEYFVKSVPRVATELKFVYPSSLKESEEAMVRQFEAWVQKEEATSFHRAKGALFALFLPFCFLGSKVFVLLFGPIFSYQAFRAISHVRAFEGLKNIARLTRSGKVSWQSQDSLDEDIAAISHQLREDGIDVESKVANGVDMDDALVARLQSEWRLPELLQTYRRTRWEELHRGTLTPPEARPTAAKNHFQA